MKMKKQYLAPCCGVIFCDAADIIRTSGPTAGFDNQLGDWDSMLDLGVGI